MIHLRDVQKSYSSGEQAVLACAVDRLDIEAGEQVALIGRSGTGKTTLLHILAGILRADSGVVEVGECGDLQNARGVAVAAPGLNDFVFCDAHPIGRPGEGIGRGCEHAAGVSHGHMLRHAPGLGAGDLAGGGRLG